MSDADIVIIGGGVVGCSVLFGLTNAGYKCILVEKEPHLVCQASAGNAGMLHTGFDAPLGSLELKCIQNCQQKIFPTLGALGLPYSKIGATMVAWNDNQAKSLPNIVQKSNDALVSEIFVLSLSELYQREPHLSPGAEGALWIPGETTTDPWLTPIMFAHHSILRGSKVYTNTLVQDCIENPSKKWCVVTDRRNIHCDLVINCAGLYGDIVDKLCGLQQFRIKPRKGQYTIYNKDSASLINSSILPVPTEKTKGVIVFKSVYNNLVVGPTAEDIEQRDTPVSIEPHITNRLRNYALRTVPALKKHNIVQMYTGNRPATETKDYHIIPHVCKNWLTVGGIRSTGLSSCLGVSDHVEKLVKDTFKLEPSCSPYPSLHRIAYKFTNHGTAIIGSEEYTVTHPLIATGISDTFYGKL